MAKLHIYRCEKPQRTRAMCPHHKHLCYGEKQEFYDTTRVFFDCGTFVDYGYGYYQPPKLYNSITIFEDEGGYSVWVPRCGWVMLAREVPLEVARSIATKRLKKGGHIVEKI
jgi:hypothetical protein